MLRDYLFCIRNFIPTNLAEILQNHLTRSNTLKSMLGIFEQSSLDFYFNEVSLTSPVPLHLIRWLLKVTKFFRNKQTEQIVKDGHFWVSSTTFWLFRVTF